MNKINNSSGMKSSPLICLKSKKKKKHHKKPDSPLQNIVIIEPHKHQPILFLTKSLKHSQSVKLQRLDNLSAFSQRDVHKNREI